MDKPDGIVELQLELSTATRKLLTAAVCVDVEDWSRAHEHVSKAKEKCGNVIRALEAQADNGEPSAT